MRSAYNVAFASPLTRATFLSVLLVTISPVASLCQGDKAKLSPQEGLAKVVIRMDKRRFQPDESISVYVDLEARGEGVYIARDWGEAGANIPGFWIRLKTEDGRPAQSCGSGADSLPASLPPASEAFKKDFFLLPAGHSIGIGHDLPCVRPIPGRYQVEASYRPNYPQTAKVAELPEARGLVLDRVLYADPITIEIR